LTRHFSRHGPHIRAELAGTTLAEFGGESPELGPHDIETGQIPKNMDSEMKEREENNTKAELISNGDRDKD